MIPPAHDGLFNNFAAIQVTLQQVCVAKKTRAATQQERRQQATAELWERDDVVSQHRKQLQKESQRNFCSPDHVHRSMPTTPVFLYMFSGRRREGDWQSHLENYMATYAVTGHVLMIDLALSSEHDVTSPALFRAFFGSIQQTRIAGILLAPPCETWSQARYQITDNPRDP